MFSAAAQSHLPPPSSSRASRRRQRPISDDSHKALNVKKQRSSFHQPDDNRDVLSLTPNRPRALAPDTHVPLLHSPQTTSKLALRGPRRPTFSGVRPDNFALLSQNDLYTISRLQPLPDEVSKTTAVQWRFTLNANYRLALALSHAEALVWPYDPDSKSSASEPLRRFSMPLDSPSNPSDPLPLGLFVSRSVEDAPGMIVVVPATGKIMLWETVSKAAVLGLMKPKKSGIQGSIPGMFFGEYATNIVNAEPSGVLVALSTGRLAHVAIRDPQGRPALSVQMLRGISGPAEGGLLANFRNVFSGTSWKRTIVSIKAGTSFQRGQRDVLLATNSGIIEVWDTRWNHGSSRKAHIDIKQHLLQHEVLGDEHAAPSFELVDFELARAPQNPAIEQDDTILYDSVLYVLFRTSHSGTVVYKVAEIFATTSDATVGKITSVPRPPPSSSASSPGSTSDASNTSPRLCSTGSAGFVYVVFGASIVLLTLLDEAGQSVSELDFLSPLKERVGLRQDRGYFIQAHELEDSSPGHDANSCLLMIQNCGLIRISPSQHLLSPGDKSSLSITVKSRIEQAIFFAEARPNPLQFGDHYFHYSTGEELDKAVYDIGDSIIRSTCPFIPTTTPSLEQQLHLRAKYLDSLASYADGHQFPLSYRTRNHLLSGAEKLAAQRAIWTVEESYRRIDPSRRTHLEQVLSRMSDQFRTWPSNEGGNDQVRQWFIHDTWRAENIIPWILNGVKCDQKPGVRLDFQLALQLQEAIEISLATLESAFKFRDNNSTLYGFHQSGVSSTDSCSWEHWTSSVVNCQETARLLDLALNVCIKWMHQTSSSNAIDSSMTSVRHRLPRSFRVLARMNQERFDWCITQADSEVQDLGKQSYSLFAKERRLQLYKLAGMGLLIEALELAEEFSDMEALVELMSELHKSLQNSSSGRQARYDSDELQEWKSRIDRYFQKFGNPWSTAFFSRRVATDEVGSLFRMPKYQHSISAFLRSAPEYSQLSWINDISGEADYGTASETLLRLAVDREVNLWSQRIELSIGKISLLASIEQSNTPLSSESSTLLREFDDLSDVSYIQERLYQHVEPMLQGIADSNARHEITKHLFAFEIGQENSVFHEIFLRSLMKLSSGLALDAVELVDVLTLIKPDFLSGEINISSNTYVLALRVLDLCRRTERDSSRLNHVEALIWRRCMISDNWRIVSNTSHQGDDELEQKVRSTLLYKTLSQMMDEHRQKGWQGSTSLPTPTQLCSNTSSVHRPELDLTREKQARVVHAINWEVKILKDYVEHDRLESWFSWILKTVAATKQDESHSK